MAADMSIADLWQSTYDLLQASVDPVLDANAQVGDAWSTATRYLQPGPPERCRFCNQDSLQFYLDIDAEKALNLLLAQSSAAPSTSKLGLGEPPPILSALCNNYISECQAAFNDIWTNVWLQPLRRYIDEGTLQDHLPYILGKVWSWFATWLSPFSSSAVFHCFAYRADDLLLILQTRFRSLVGRDIVQALEGNLRSLITAPADVNALEKAANSLLLQHIQATGLAATALTLLNRVLHSEITRKVRAVMGSAELRDYDEALPLQEQARPSLKRWLDADVKPRFSAVRDACTHAPRVIAGSANHTTRQLDQDEILDESTWESRLDYQLDKTLCQVRAEQLFDLIAIYPESENALSDLGESLATTDQKLLVSKQLSASLQLRLLHPGAHTRDIIQMYVHMVRALREVDPSGVVLSRVVSPLRKYLRGRKDTIPVIVASMLGDDPNFTLLKDELEQADQEEQAAEDALSADMTMRRKKRRRSLQTHKARKTPSSSRRGDATRRQAGRAVSDSDDSSDEDWSDPDWVPKPIDAGRSYRLSTSKDIISMLISIFDDRSGFIAAMEKSMAEQLVKVKGYRAMKEYRNNMILKKRFGERNMGKCDVMLGDVTDSRRIDSVVHSRLARGDMIAKLHPLIVSRQFWPENTTVADTAPFTLPPIFQQAQEEYSKTYAQTKAMRRLHWLNHLGTVELDVELDSGQTLAIECTPLQAATLEVITRCLPDPPASTARIITLTALMQQLNLQHENDAHQALLFWTRAGLLRPIDGLSDTFAVQESLAAQP